MPKSAQKNHSVLQSLLCMSAAQNISGHNNSLSPSILIKMSDIQHGPMKHLPKQMT